MLCEVPQYAFLRSSSICGLAFILILTNNSLIAHTMIVKELECHKVRQLTNLVATKLFTEKLSTNIIHEVKL